MRATPTSLRALPLFARLAPCRRILIAGAGGGFDVFAGLPLYLALRDDGKDVFLANLTFTPLEAYELLVRELRLDAVVLVDGGTDILMRGDEAGLGTPEEDMTSLAASSRLDVAEKLVVCLGFGIDTFHGVCHAHFLENVAALTREGGFLGAFSVLPSMPEAQGFLAAVQYAQERTPGRPSIVNGSIAAAVQGEFGNVQFTTRTAGSELFVSPLMAIYFGFDLDGVVRRSLYLPLLEGTRTVFEVSARIEAFRHSVTTRQPRAIPH